MIEPIPFVPVVRDSHGGGRAPRDRLDRQAQSEGEVKGSLWQRPLSYYWLKRGAGSVDHEVLMFVTLAGWLIRDTIPAHLRGAVLEAWLVHVRSLLDFFHPRPNPHRTDVLATDFLPDKAEWEAALPRLTQAGEQRRADLDKLLAHISYTRHKRDSDWSTADYEMIRCRLDLFFKHLPKRRRRWFKGSARLFV